MVAQISPRHINDKLVIWGLYYFFIFVKAP